MLEEESHPLSRSIKMKNMENIGGSGPPGPLNWHNQEYTVGGTQDRTLTLPPRDHGDRTTTKRPLPHDHPNLAESFRPTEKALIEKAKSLRLHIPTSKLRSSKPLSPENASQNEIETLLRHELQQSEFSRSNQTLTECSVPSQFIDLTASAASGSSRIQNVYASLQSGPPLLPGFVESGIENVVAPTKSFSRSASFPPADPDVHMSGIENHVPNPPASVNIAPGSSKNGNSRKLPMTGSATNETSDAAHVTKRKRTPKYAGIPHVLLPFGIHAPEETQRKTGAKPFSSNDSLVGATARRAKEVGVYEEGFRLERGLQNHVVGVSAASLANQASTSNLVLRYSQNPLQTQHLAPNLPYTSQYTSPVQLQATSQARSLATKMSGPSMNPPQPPPPRVQGSSHTTSNAPQNDAVWITRLSDGRPLSYPLDFQAPGSGLGLAPYNDHTIIALLEAGYDCRVHSPSNFMKLLARSPNPKGLVSAWRTKNPTPEAPGFSEKISDRLRVFISGIHNIRHVAVKLVELDKLIDPQSCTPAEKEISDLAQDVFIKNALALSHRSIQSGWLAHVDQGAHAAEAPRLSQATGLPRAAQAANFPVAQALSTHNGATQQQKSTPRECHFLYEKFNTAKSENTRATNENNTLKSQLAAAQAQITHLQADRDFYKLQVDTSTVTPGKPYIIPEVGRLYIFGQLVDEKNPEFRCDRLLPRDIGQQKKGEVCGHVNRFYVCSKESNYVWFDREKCEACRQVVRKPYTFLEPEKARAEEAFNIMAARGRKGMRSMMTATLPGNLTDVGVGMTPQPPVLSSGFALPAAADFAVPVPPPVPSSGLFLPQVRGVKTSSLTLPQGGSPPPPTMEAQSGSSVGRAIEISEDVVGLGNEDAGVEFEVDDPEINALFEEDEMGDDDLEAALRAALEK